MRILKHIELRQGVYLTILCTLGLSLTGCAALNGAPKYSIDPNAKAPVLAEAPAAKPETKPAEIAPATVAVSAQAPVVQKDLPAPGPAQAATPAQTPVVASTTTAPVASVVESPKPVSSPSASRYAYIMQAHDTLFGVSRRFGIPIKSLMDSNGLSPQSGVKIGQKIILSDQAKDKGVDPHATGPGLIDLHPQNVAVPKSVLPSNKPETPSVKPADTTKPTATPQPQADAGQKPKPTVASAEALPKGFPAASVISERGKGHFIWPLTGDIVVKYGQIAPNVKNDGVNIAASEGTPVKAAASGEVVYVGSDVKELGLTVYVKNANGFYTGYSHLKATKLKAHQKLAQGDVIGQVGKSGSVNSPQLHFEIRFTPSTQIAKPIDPALVLP